MVTTMPATPGFRPSGGGASRKIEPLSQEPEYINGLWDEFIPDHTAHARADEGKYRTGRGRGPGGGRNRGCRNDPGQQKDPAAAPTSAPAAMGRIWSFTCADPGACAAALGANVGVPASSVTMIRLATTRRIIIEYSWRSYCTASIRRPQAARKRFRPRDRAIRPRATPYGCRHWPRYQLACLRIRCGRGP